MEEGSRARPSRRSSVVSGGAETPDRAEAPEDAERTALASPSVGEALPSASGVPLSSAAGREGSTSAEAGTPPEGAPQTSGLPRRVRGMSDGPRPPAQVARPVLPPSFLERVRAAAEAEQRLEQGAEELPARGDQATRSAPGKQQPPRLVRRRDWMARSGNNEGPGHPGPEQAGEGQTGTGQAGEARPAVAQGRNGAPRTGAGPADDRPRPAPRSRGEAGQPSAPPPLPHRQAGASNGPRPPAVVRPPAGIGAMLNSVAADYSTEPIPAIRVSATGEPLMPTPGEGGALPGHATSPVGTTPGAAEQPRPEAPAEGSRPHALARSGKRARRRQAATERAAAKRSAADQAAADQAARERASAERAAAEQAAAERAARERAAAERAAEQRAADEAAVQRAAELLTERKASPGRSPRLVGLAAGVLVLVGAVALALHFIGHSGRPGRPVGGTSPTSEVVIRQHAAAWVASQISRSDVVSCDPVTCLLLKSDGFPSAHVRALTASSRSPLGSTVVVATPVIRRQIGARLSSSYAPSILARFGSGDRQIDIRTVAPDGAAAYRVQLNADLRARQTTGTAVAQTSQIVVSPRARRQLEAGQVDSRLIFMLALMATQHPVHVLAFADAGPDPRMAPFRSAELAVANNANAQKMLEFLHGQQAPYQLTRVAIKKQGQSQTVLWMEFAAPSPFNLPNS